MKIRLDKYLADMSIGTRAKAKQLVRAGRIKVNDNMIKDASVKVDTEDDRVSFDDTPVLYLHYEYYMLNKPAGVITAVSDEKEKTVLELIDSARKDLFPVGRLDRDTVGLLLITNNGELSHNMLSPRKHVDKTYYVELDDVLSEEMCSRITEGVVFEKNRISLPARLEILENIPGSARVNLTIHEGRFHQVKKMFEAVGRQVIFLKRIEFGPLKLDQNLKYGEYRKLSEEELASLEKYM